MVGCNTNKIWHENTEWMESQWRYYIRLEINLKSIWINLLRYDTLQHCEWKELENNLSTWKTVNSISYYNIII